MAAGSAMAGKWHTMGGERASSCSRRRRSPLRKVGQDARRQIWRQAAFAGEGRHGGAWRTAARVSIAYEARPLGRCCEVATVRVERPPRRGRLAPRRRTTSSTEEHTESSASYSHRRSVPGRAGSISSSRIAACHPGGVIGMQRRKSRVHVHVWPRRYPITQMELGRSLCSAAVDGGIPPPAQLGIWGPQGGPGGRAWRVRTRMRMRMRMTLGT